MLITGPSRPATVETATDAIVMPSRRLHRRAHGIEDRSNRPSILVLADFGTAFPAAAALGWRVGMFSKDDARIRTKRTWLFVASIAVPLVCALPALFSLSRVFVAQGTLARVGGGLGYLAYLGALIGLGRAWQRSWLERRGRLRADERGLWFNDALLVGRSSIRHGNLLRREDSSYVRLGRSVQLVEVDVVDDEEGEALLSAMRLDSGRSVGLYQLKYRTHRATWICFGMWMAVSLAWLLGVLLATRGNLFLPAYSTWAVAWCAWLVNANVRVAVGADGIRIRRWLSRSRFIPFGAFASADTDGRNVALRLRDGTVIDMHNPSAGKKGWFPRPFPDRAEDARMLVQRINARMDQHRHRAGHLPALARAGRSTQEWVRQVTVASDDHASFRAPAVPVDELWRVVEDPAAPSAERAGAALALRARLDDEGRTRLRVVAEACAGPRLRVALQVAASTAAEDAIEEAFESLLDNEHGGGGARFA